MPTTQPLDEDELGDIFEGQLKPIAGFGQVAPQAPTPSAPKAAMPKATPRVEPAKQVAEPRTATEPETRHSPIKGTVRLTGIKAPNISLSGHKEQPQPSQQTVRNAVQTAPQKRENAYEDKDVLEAWKRFIRDNNAEHLLVNAMRAVEPRRVSGDTFCLAQSNVHLHYIREDIERLTRYVRNAAGNDNISFVFEEVSEDSPIVWNERELLQKMIEANPSMGEFIRDLKLKIM